MVLDDCVSSWLTEKREEGAGLNIGEISTKRVRKSCVALCFIVVTAYDAFAYDVFNGDNRNMRNDCFNGESELHSNTFSETSVLRESQLLKRVFSLEDLSALST